MARDHLVTPALAWRLANGPAVPNDLAAYFAAALLMGQKRAEAARRAIGVAGATLNGADVEPVMLKGMAGLMDGLYPDPGARLFLDIDILVPAAKAAQAQRALARTGWEVQPASDRFLAEHHHLPMMIHPDYPFGIELHREPVVTPLRRLLAADGVIGRSCPIALDGVRVRVPSPTDRVVHTIAHAQIADAGYRRGVPQLRALLDLCLLRNRYEPEINWPEITVRFKRAGYGAVLVETLTLAELLLGQPAPLGLGRSPAKAKARLQRALSSRTRARAVGIGSLLSRYWGAVRHEPAAALNLLRAGSRGRLLAALGRSWRGR